MIIYKLYIRQPTILTDGSLSLYCTKSTGEDSAAAHISDIIEKRKEKKVSCQIDIIILFKGFSR